ncbi:MAG: hypothetical protein HYV07_33310 [Deltaproteobacteria bacterium]|nr:hypothetical protein [Deltaproteobacteria bacterium]
MSIGHAASPLVVSCAQKDQTLVSEAPNVRIPKVDKNNPALRELMRKVPQERALIQSC